MDWFAQAAAAWAAYQHTWTQVVPDDTIGLFALGLAAAVWVSG